jgi:hypothetical protein
MKKERIEQVEPQLAQKLHGPWKDILQELNFHVPKSGYQLRVSLHNAKGRKKPSNAAADNWSPQSSDRAEIWFEPVRPQQEKAALETPARGNSVTNGEAGKSCEDNANREIHVHPAEVELLKALDRTEARPGWSFVSLKKFRDEILPAEPHAPGGAKLTDADWQGALRSAIEKRLILTNKVANPKSPQFPVTSIRLNRLMPEVQKVLGKDKADLDFHPIRIQGEPLSATILRERR